VRKAPCGAREKEKRKEKPMMTRTWVKWSLGMAGVAVIFLLAVPGAEAQDRTAAFLEQTKTTASQGWGLLSSIGTVVIGGGALIGLAAGMYQGKWGHAAISFVAGAAGLLTLWGFGKVLGF
jgi:hypothetical protein